MHILQVIVILSPTVRGLAPTVVNPLREMSSMTMTLEMREALRAGGGPVVRSYKPHKYGQMVQVHETETLPVIRNVCLLFWS